MTDREKVIAAYICSNKKPPDKRCEKCPYGYEYLDQTGDNYVVGCNTERIMVDAIDLLKVKESVKPKWRKGYAYCGQCGYKLHWIVEQNNFCSNCGRAVKWR